MSDRPDPDERVTLPLDPEVALRALLAVDPDAEPVSENDPGEAREPERQAKD